MWKKSMARIVLFKILEILSKTITPLTSRAYTTTLGCMLSIVLASTALCESMVKVDLIFKAYFDGDKTRLMELMSDMDANTLLELGLVSLAEQEPTLAHACFEGAVNVNPSNQRAQLELARTLFYLGEAAQAAEKFSQVLASNPPVNVQQNIGKFLDRIAREQALKGDDTSWSISTDTANMKSSKWLTSAAVTAGGSYDSNVNFGPSKQTINIKPVSLGALTFDQLNVGKGSQPVESFSGFVYGQASAIYLMDSLGRKAWVSGVELYNNWVENAEQFNLLNAGVSSGLRLTTSDSFLDVPLKYSHAQLDGQAFLNQWSISPYYRRKMGEDHFSITSLQLKLRSYEDAPQLDGTVVELEQSYRRVYGDAANRIELTGGVGYEDTDATAFENVSMTIRLSGQVALSNMLIPNAAVAYTQSQYMGREVLAPEDRVDDELSLNLGLARPISEQWILSLNFQYIDVQSTFDLYTYDRSIFSVSSLKEF
ncbi:MAG: tetratricopeptide (TPR) repeat protein [Kiritimatiellia bacterium]|jgi:tetratricopeptide (TPR) repeat protein